MKSIILLSAFLIASFNLSAANDINIKKLGENSASFVVNSDQTRTVLVLYPSTEMLPNLDAVKKSDLTKEAVDLSSLKPFKNNAYIVFDGSQSAIPLSIKGLKANSGYFLAMVKPDAKNFKPVIEEFATLAAEPQKQVKGIAFREPNENSIPLIWSNGDGSSCLVVASKGKIDMPEDGKEYKASAKFGEAKIGSNSYVIYSGDKNEIKMENLDPATNYNFQIFAFNGKGKSTNYNLDKNSGNPRNKMTAIPAPTVLPASDISEIGFIIKWKGAGKIDKYLIDIAYDEKFSKFAETYESADVGDIEEIEVTALNPDKPWFFRVRAVGEGTVSPFSNVMKVKK